MTRRLLVAAVVWLVGSTAIFAAQVGDAPPFAGTYVYYLAQDEFGPVSPDPTVASAVANDSRRFATADLPDGTRLALPAGTVEATRTALTDRFWAERWRRRGAALTLPTIITVVPPALLLALTFLPRLFSRHPGRSLPDPSCPGGRAKSRDP